MSFDAAGCSWLFNARIASRMTANGTPRRFAAVPNFGSDRSEADMPRASGACRSDENDPTRTWSEGRADTVALATEQCAPVLMKGRRRLRRLIYDDVKLVRDTIQRLGAGTAPPGAVYIGRGSPYGNPFVVGRMLTNTCPAAGTGVGTSRSVMTSGPPTSKSCMACMRSVHICMWRARIPALVTAQPIRVLHGQSLCGLSDAKLGRRAVRPVRIGQQRTPHFDQIHLTGTQHALRQLRCIHAPARCHGQSRFPSDALRDGRKKCRSKTLAAIDVPFSESGRSARPTLESRKSPQIAGYSSETGKRRFASDCVVGPGGLEPPTRPL